MNRVVITLDANGEIDSICADEPVQIYWNQPSRPHDRVYLYGSAEFGPEHVRKAIGGYAVGHAFDGTLGVGNGTGKRPPSKPHIGEVK